MVAVLTHVKIRMEVISANVTLVTSYWKMDSYAQVEIDIFISIKLMAEQIEV